MGVAGDLAVNSTAVTLATVFTHPLDVVKVRLQILQRQQQQQQQQQVKTTTASATTSSPARRSMARVAATLVREEGASALMKGLPAALLRGGLYGGLRLGLYDTSKRWMGLDAQQSNASKTNSITGSSHSHSHGAWLVGRKLLAGVVSGTIAVAVCNPLELLKVRMQATQSATRELNPLQNLVQLARREGVGALWNGVRPAALRGAALTASQAVTYDEAKQQLLARGWGDGVHTQLGASLLAGLVTTTVTNPADVVKTYMMFRPDGQGPLRTNSVFRAFAHIYAAEGPAAFFKGWLPNYLRLAPQTTLIFLIAEQLRRFVPRDA